MKFVGIAKTLFNSNAALVAVNNNKLDINIFLSERIERIKYCGHWPMKALKKLTSYDCDETLEVLDNSDLILPCLREESLFKKDFFDELLIKNQLTQFTHRYNENLTSVNHHLAHAYSAQAMSPFHENYILVMDGGGSTNEDAIEHCSLYYWDGGSIKLLEKHFINYIAHEKQQRSYSNGLGSFYEKCAEYIFNDKNASGKVMGLAAFGQKEEIVDRIKFQRSLDWVNSFSGEDKRKWEEHWNLNNLKNLAATVQNHFENSLISICNKAANRYFPQYGEHPLILTGGCALNCSANMKLYNKKIFPQIYVSPIPSDNSIGLGAAIIGAYRANPQIKLQRSWQEQTSAFGPDSSESIEQNFSDYDIMRITDFKKVSTLLKEGQVIAWFYGRSECGARALGHRSLIADPSYKGIKSFLNEKIKFRESFRPYGATVLWDMGHKYFEVPNGFQNPFMSFTCKVRSEHEDTLSEITHKDGTCRMQTLMREQNHRLYELIECFSESDDNKRVPILLNTSLNIMGEPIVESYQDLAKFFERSYISFMVVDDHLIAKRQM